jgi:hypothetical protein
MQAAMQAKVSVNARPTVTAGLAKLVDEVNQVRGTDIATDCGRRGVGATAPSEREDQQDQAGGGDNLTEPQMAGRPPGGTGHITAVASLASEVRCRPTHVFESVDSGRPARFLLWGRSIVGGLGVVGDGVSPVDAIG